MRLRDVFTFCLASVAAAVPWTARGGVWEDARHQRRHEAAEILRDAIQEAEDASATGTDVFELYQSAVARAFELIGPDCRAATRLNGALRDARQAAGPSDAVLRGLGDRIEAICEDLAFAPLMEAETPQGFPAPTPVGEIEVKQYPAYRMALTEAGETLAFWTLFAHIKREGIAMTAPVEMSYGATEAGEPAPRAMAFLYQSRDLGETGSEGSVRVVDVPAQEVVSMGVRGDRTREKIASVRRLLIEWIDVDSSAYKPAGEMRVMGYNSPFVPKARRYFEVQIPVEGLGGNAPSDASATGDR